MRYKEDAFDQRPCKQEPDHHQERVEWLPRHVGLQIRLNPLILCQGRLLSVLVRLLSSNPGADFRLAIDGGRLLSRSASAMAASYSPIFCWLAVICSTTHS